MLLNMDSLLDHMNIFEEPGPMQLEAILTLIGRDVVTMLLLIFGAGGQMYSTVRTRISSIMVILRPFCMQRHISALLQLRRTDFLPYNGGQYFHL